MAQAKSLTPRELRKVLDHLPVNKYRSRNRLMLLLTHWSGMRVGDRRARAGFVGRAQEHCYYAGVYRCE